MHSWLHRLSKGGDLDPPQQHLKLHNRPQKRTNPVSTLPKDANVPRKRLQIHQRCLYERMLPGSAYISAHVNRLQHGFHQSSALHEDLIDDVYFVSVHFVFHPHDPNSHRFKRATIKVSVCGGEDPSASTKHHWKPASTSQPRILKHAPELMFGAVSPESLQWNFSLSSSLGVSQAPVSATLNPTGGMNGSYKVFHMMSIQGSIRSKRSAMGPDHDVEDGMAVWTLEENMLQRSGLPREFDFVLLVHKPADVTNVFLTVDVDADVEAWYGTYPQWYTNLSKYMPTQDFRLDFDADIGQRFVPSLPGRGFNFASLPHPLDQYVTMPGTVYPTNDTKGDDSSNDRQSTRRGTRSLRTYGDLDTDSERHSWAPGDLNLRVVLENQYPQQTADARRHSQSPRGTQEPSRYPSIRRRKSRTGLKQYGAKQALRQLANEALSEHASIAVNEQSDGHT